MTKGFKKMIIEAGELQPGKYEITECFLPVAK